MNQDAIYEYKYFDSYFIDNDRYAFFIREYVILIKDLITMVMIMFH